MLKVLQDIQEHKVLLEVEVPQVFQVPQDIQELKELQVVEVR